MAPTTKIKVLIFLRNQANKLLLIKETSLKKPTPSWNFIRGTYDIPGENINDTVIREVTEEVGITNLNNLEFINVKIFYKEKKTRFYFIYSAETSQEPKINQQIIPQEDIIEAKWFSLEEIHKLNTQDFIDDIIYELAQEIPQSIISPHDQTKS